VIGTDLLAGPLAFIERASRSERLVWLTTRCADMESLPFEDATFDAVTCRLGIMFCAQPALALREIRRVLKPGARAAFIVWGSRAQPLFAATLATMGGYFSSHAESPTELPGPFRFEIPGSLASELHLAGFSAVHEEQRVIAWPFRGSPARHWQMFRELAGPGFRRAIETLAPEQQRELTERVIDNLRAHQRGDVIDPTARLNGCSAIA
jgi:SAM-dependent methyltransferase